MKPDGRLNILVHAPTPTVPPLDPAARSADVRRALPFSPMSRWFG